MRASLMRKWCVICLLLLIASTSAFAQSSTYIVDGLALGGRVRFESDAYKQYNCGPSDKFPGFTWCHKEKTEQTSRGEVTSSSSILHRANGMAAYINHYVEPAFFGPHEVQDEINRLSAKFGERAREFRMPPRRGLPNAIIALWGKIQLVPLDQSEVSTVASGGTVKGLLVSFLGDLQRSAKAGAPVYRLSGGAGYLWAATFNHEGKGVLRFLSFDASFVVAHNESVPPLSPRSQLTEQDTGYGKDWYVSSFWSGEYPPGFSAVKEHTTVLARTKMDKAAPRSVSCELPYLAVIHPWNEIRIAKSKLQFLSASKITPLIAKEAFTFHGSVGRKEVTLPIAKGDKIDFLRYDAEGEFEVRISGKQYTADQDLYDHVQDVPAEQSVEDDWVHLNCENGGQAYIFLHDITTAGPDHAQTYAPGFSDVGPGQVEYGRARDLTAAEANRLLNDPTAGPDTSQLSRKPGPPATSSGLSPIAEQASILASTKYDGQNAARLQYGDLLIKIDREPASEKDEWLPVVDAQDKTGRKLFTIRLSGDEARGQKEPAAEVRVMDLDPANHEPQLIFTYFWGGAHCCTVTQIATADAEGRWHVIDGGALDGDGYQFLDLDQDGGSELVTVDNSFLYAFGCYACSYAPTHIQKLVGTRLKDVTKMEKYQAFLRERLQQMEADALRNSGESDIVRTTGYLGGWVAAKALLGEFSGAWATMLDTYEPNPDWPMDECLRPLPMDQCAKSEQHETDFPNALAAHLLVHGYITAADRDGLTYKTSEKPSDDVQPQTETPAVDTSTPLGLCGAAINDPLRPMLIDTFISGGKHLGGGGLTAAIKDEIEHDYGSFLTIRNDATVERVDGRTGKIGCAVTYEANLQGLAEKVLQEGANTRAKILIGQMAREGKDITRRLPYTVQRTSGGSFMVWLGLR